MHLYIKDNHEKYHIFFNYEGFHKYVVIPHAFVHVVLIGLACLHAAIRRTTCSPYIR